MFYYQFLNIHFQDLFFQYSLNNFLHAQVETCIKYAFCCVNAPLAPAVASKAVSDPSLKDNNNSAEDKKSGTTCLFHHQ